MGGETSIVTPTYPTSFGAAREYGGYSTLDDHPQTSVIKRPTTFGFSAVWSIRPINSVHPTQRIGQCSVYFPEADCAIIAYGADTNGDPLSDFWALDFKSSTWRQINVDQTTITPRVGARAVLIDHNMWIYGGYRNKEYLSDLHIVNIDTGEVYRPQTSGNQPAPCAGHGMEHVAGKIILFGGFNGTQLSQLCILDTHTLEWKMLPHGQSRYSMSYAVNNNRLYAYGGSHITGVMQIDPDIGLIESSKEKGPSPPNTLTKSSMVALDRYLLVIGGDPPPNKDIDNYYAPIYAFDIKTSQWFIFPISPDGHTVNFADGQIDKLGNFNLPICSDSVAVYRSQKREIIIFLGQPFKDPPVQVVLSVGDALSVLHCQADMVDMLTNS